MVEEEDVGDDDQSDGGDNNGFPPCTIHRGEGFHSEWGVAGPQLFENRYFHVKLEWKYSFSTNLDMSIEDDGQISVPAARILSHDIDPAKWKKVPDHPAL